MKENAFENSGPPLASADVAVLEALLKAQLPEEFCVHYYKYNGGLPTLDWFPSMSNREPIWIHEFLPIETGKAGSSGRTTIQSVYEIARSKELFPSFLFAFALDPGGNFFCLDVNDGSVCYWLNDVFDPGLGRDENWKKARRELTSSFEEFMNCLVSEDEAYD